MTITCPSCQRPHDLFYWVQSNGKKEASIICDRQTSIDAHGKAFRSTKRIKGIYLGSDPLPEQWSAGWAKKQQNQQNLQLVLMNHEKSNSPV